LGREVAGKVTLKQIYEIAKIEKQDSSMKKLPRESLYRIIIGSLKLFLAEMQIRDTMPIVLGFFRDVL